MNLKTYNAENASSIKVGSPRIGVNQKTGLFNFSKTAVDQLGLKDGDQVAFHQDEDEPENWYVEKVKSGGLVVRTKEEVTYGCLMNSRLIATRIGESVDRSDSLVLILAGEPTKLEKRTLWGLLIKA